MLHVVFLGDAVVVDVLVFPGCFHSDFVSLKVFLLESVYRDVHIYNDDHVLLAFVDRFDLKHWLDPSFGGWGFCIYLTDLTFITEFLY